MRTSASSLTLCATEAVIHVGDKTFPKQVKGFELIRFINSGGFAYVFQALDMRRRQTVALKFVSREIFGETINLYNFEKELRLFARLDHPNIAKYYGTIYYEDYIIVVMEFLSGGSLTEIITSNFHSIQEKTYLRWAKEILEALDYLHERNIVHRDIKPDNIIFDDLMSAKLVDFGLSTEYGYGKRCSTPCGTPFFTAPEVLQMPDYDGPKADIWSFGLTLYLLVTKDFPFPHMTQKQYIQNMHKLESLMEKRDTGVFADIIEHSLTFNPKERYTAKQLLALPVFQQAEVIPKLGVLRGSATWVAQRKTTIGHIKIHSIELQQAIRPNIIAPALRKRPVTRTPN